MKRGLGFCLVYLRVSGEEGNIICFFFGFSFERDGGN